MAQMFNNISQGLYPSKNRDYVNAYDRQRRQKIRACVARRPYSYRTHKNVVITTPFTENQLRNIQVIETAKDCNVAPINIAVKVLQSIIKPIISVADKKELDRQYQAKYYQNKKLAKRIAEIDAMPPPPMPELAQCPYVNVVSVYNGKYVML
jgi:hypothetical protein